MTKRDQRFGFDCELYAGYEVLRSSGHDEMRSAFWVQAMSFAEYEFCACNWPSRQQKSPLQ
ncbi:MAG: hypothetical protein IJQ58_09760 [Synergistaceae bacterium]|nr:hypothetical protein [Synergistaceae bacterium]